MTVFSRLTALVIVSAALTLLANAASAQMMGSTFQAFTEEQEAAFGEMCVELQPPLSAAPSVAPPPGLNVDFAVFDRGCLWRPGQTIKIRFLDGSQYMRENVRRHAMEWTRYANLNFDFGDHADADIRISFAGGSSWSFIGTCKPQDFSSTTMNFGWFSDSNSPEEFKGTTLHEFGHMIGMKHEHQSPVANIPWDRDAVIAYYRATSGWSVARTERNVLSPPSNTNHSRFDPTSIMLYSVPNELTIGDFEITRQREALSDLDKQWAAQIYPGRTPGSGGATSPTEPTTPALRALSVGQTLSGSLSGDVRTNSFTFSATAGQQLTVYTGGPGDTVLTILGSDRNEIGRNDDESQGVYTSRVTFTAPSTGGYVAIVEGYNNNPVPNYTITLETSGEAPTAPEATSLTVNGTTALSTENSSAQARATLQIPTEASSYTVSLDGSDCTFDSKVTVTTTSGERVAFNDDIDAGARNYCSAVTFEADGGSEFVVLLEPYNRERTGNTNLRTTLTPIGRTASISEGDNTIGLNGSFVELPFQVPGNSGSTVQLTLATRDCTFDPVMEVFRGDERIAQNDDYNDSLCPTVSVPVLGGMNLTIRLQPFSQSERGELILNVTAETSAGPTQTSGGSGSATDGASQLTLNTPPATGRIATAGSTVLYRLDLRPDTYYGIQTQGNTDTTIRVYNGSEELLVEDDDSGEGTNAYAIFQASAIRPHYVMVGGYGQTTGQFTIQAEEIDAQPIRMGQSVNGEISDRGEADIFLLELEAGSPFSVTVESPNCSFDSVLTLTDWLGRVVARNDDESQGRRCSAIRTEAQISGVHFVIVSGYGDVRTGAYTLQVTTMDSGR